MTEYIKLLGVEEIARAGGNIAGAAEQMNQAVVNLSAELSILNEQLEDKLQRFEQLVARIEALKTAPWQGGPL